MNNSKEADDRAKQPAAPGELEVARAMTTMIERPEAPPGMRERLRFVAAIVRDLPSNTTRPALAFRPEPQGPVSIVSIGQERIIGRVLPEFDRDAHLSRRHFRVIMHEGQYVLEDLGSRNGTYVNGVRVQSHLLRDGDVIGAARRFLVFLRGMERER